MSELEKNSTGKGSLGKVVAIRLGPGCDLMKSLEEIVKRENIPSGLILSGADSLSQVTLRNARFFPDEFPVRDRYTVSIRRKKSL